MKSVRDKSSKSLQPEKTATKPTPIEKPKAGKKVTPVLGECGSGYLDSDKVGMVVRRLRKVLRDLELAQSHAQCGNYGLADCARSDAAYSLTFLVDYLVGWCE